ncbi:cation-translocating P-type ATPase [Tahibacter amnicola]|uniref:Cation-translocating P-type ATPase n=1 Tax=Tahibacter amnicola TaxID=2976241 RepID=A0ABY6B885_9GAMM|nr:cation-translocating P-type ATPase [Tahibacter amnicola]UXI65987.1 cation-translocating P-type ATPase [Tahibacter amnicola]
MLRTDFISRTSTRDTTSAVWSGLASTEALHRLQVGGPNALPQPPRRTLLRLAVGVLREPMFLLLICAASLYLVIGDPSQGVLLAGFAALTVALVVVQQARSEHALEALRTLGAPTARVMRDGIERRIAATDVVVGDLILISEGERVPADGVLRRADQLSIDESLLTGESAPVQKCVVDEPTPGSPGGDGQPWIYAGTLVVAGHGIAEVRATGIATQAGRIGLALAAIDLTATPLQQNIGRLVRLFGLLALIVCGIVVLLNGVLRDAWFDGAQTGIALAMAILPEEFPMVLAVFLALGAWRLARQKVLVRRPAVVEALGATTVLCLDKTGTLTENRMRVRALSIDGETMHLRGDETVLPEAFHTLLEYGVLASKRRAIDPMDRATTTLAVRTLTGTEHLHEEWPLRHEYGLTHELPALTRVWQDTLGRRVVASKGAPEAIARLCRLDDAVYKRRCADVEALARQGLRVLAVAAAQLGGDESIDRPSEIAFQWIGLLAFEDPLRAGAASAIATARAAGIAVVMITGDYPATAREIARQAGIDTGPGVVDGTMLDGMDDAQLDKVVRAVRVFARIRPEQKLRLVEALQRAGEVVAMTGDGVNDAPALKAAHIGLALGSRATDVAREAAGIVLLNDDVGDLVEGIRQGRRIFDNLRKAMVYIIAIHLPIAGLALLPLLFGLPTLLLPAHVVLIEMVIDPVCSIAFESTPAARDLMDRPPRPSREPLVAGKHFALGLVQGGLLLAATILVYTVALAGNDEGTARALALITLTAGNLTLVRVNMARGSTLASLWERGHAAFWWIAATAGVVITICIVVPGVARLFHFSAPSLHSVLLAIAFGTGSVLLFDFIKKLLPASPGERPPTLAT